MMNLENFDLYVEQHEIQPEELGAAFGAWLNELSGWDGDIERVGETT